MEMNEDYISHHGVIGQKWGVRRYQNPDGSLTPEGQKRVQQMDEKWLKNKEPGVRKKAYKQAMRDRSTKKAIKEVDKEFKSEGGKKNKDGSLKASYTNRVNRIIASSMTEKVSDIRTPTGKVVSFVAATGSHKIGDVYTGISDPGYDLSRMSRGINKEGKLSYRRKKKENYIDRIEM